MNTQTSSVKTIGGVPTLTINDEPFYSPAYVTYLPKNNNYELFKNAGIHMYSVCVYFGGQTINEDSEINLPTTKGIFDEKGKPDFSIADRDFQRIIDIDPQAKIFPRVNMSLPRWWEEENPDELNDNPSYGKKWDNLGNTSNVKEKKRVCMDSKKWLEQTNEFLKIFIEHYKNSEIGNYIIGLQLAGGSTEEWFPFDFNSGIGKRTREEFEKSPLNDGTEGALYRFIAENMANSISYLAKTAKECTNNKIVVGVFYGYTLECIDRKRNSGALSVILACPYIDFICAPLSYAQTRKPGIDHSCITALDSITLNGMLYFTEADERTYLSLYPYEHEGLCKDGTYTDPIWKGPKDAYTTRQVLKNDFARQLIHSNNFWWFDMWGGWYNDKGIMEDMAKEAEIMKNSVTLADRRYVAELAVFIDEKTHYISDSHNNVGFNFRIPIGSSGVPYAVYEMSDFDKVKDNYKAIILLEPYKTQCIDNAKITLENENKAFMVLTNDIILTPELFREFARKNGLHIYIESNDVVHVCNNFISVHKGENTERKTVINLPGVRKITPIIDEGESFVSNKIELELDPFETRLYKLDD